MELVTFCVYCGGEVNNDINVCLHCQEYDGVVDGYVDENGEYQQFERNVCSCCNNIENCVRIENKLVCVECLNEKGML